MTVGPWRPITIHTYETRISDLYIKSTVSEEFEVNVDVNFTLSDTIPAAASVVLKSPDGVTIMGSNNVRITDGQATVSYKFSRGSVDLWYPVGYGHQPLYTVDVHVSHEVHSVIRLRTVSSTANKAAQARRRCHRTHQVRICHLPKHGPCFGFRQP